ncbi:MAG: acyltransferase [Fulvivirga sp.]
MKKLIDYILAAIGLILYLISEKIFNHCIRKFHNNRLQRRLKTIGNGCIIHGESNITGLEKIEIGNNVQINTNALIRGEGGLVIGDNTHIARNVVIYTHNHNYEGMALPYDNTFRFRPVIIEKNVWIGVNVTVLPGAHIGEGAIIGAGSVVGGKVDSLAIYGASEGRVIKYRDKNHYNLLEEKKSYGGPNGNLL